MAPFSLDDDLSEIHVRGALPRIKNYDRRAGSGKKSKPASNTQAALPELQAGSDREKEFNFTYRASRHERAWMEASLGSFYEQHWFDDVLKMVRGGKEATVYLCRANSTTHRDLLAAKVYRPRMFRNLRNDHIYREGRSDLDENGRIVVNDGMLHAIHKRTEYGRTLMHTSWIQYEYTTMRTLYAAGADLPEPLACDQNAVLMEYIGSLEEAAPTLNTIELDHSEAMRLFDRVMRNVEILLSHDRIHGDLSAFNLLYWQGRIYMIDFPQVINTRDNVNALRIFERDVARICGYFNQQGVKADAHRIAHALWTASRHPLRPALDPAYLDADNADDRKAWARESK